MSLFSSISFNSRPSSIPYFASCIIFVQGLPLVHYFTLFLLLSIKNIPVLHILLSLFLYFFEYILDLVKEFQIVELFPLQFSFILVLSYIILFSLSYGFWNSILYHLFSFISPPYSPIFLSIFHVFHVLLIQFASFFH